MKREFKFNAVKERRKELVAAIADITGCKSRYCGAPGFAFAVGGYTVDRDGTLICDEQTDGQTDADTRNLLLKLTERGFTFEGDIDCDMAGDSAELSSGEESCGEESHDEESHGEESCGEESRNEESRDEESCGEESRGAETAEADTDSDKISIGMPLSGFNPLSLDNLEKLIAAKAWIIKKMAETDELPIERDEDEGYLRFPWFKLGASAVEIDAYSRLIIRLCETAKEKKRVVATEKQLNGGDNEKFKARCFLLALGFIGEDYAQARKVLLAPMSGSGSFKNGNSKKADGRNRFETDNNGGDKGTEPVVHETAEAEETAETTETVETAEATAQNSGSDAVSRKCGECQYHRYYTDGLLRTNAGDIIDISKRTPGKYTHYCLNTPSGYRKLKHANDWSGCETAPKWCPLFAKNEDTIISEEEEAI